MKRDLEQKFRLAFFGIARNPKNFSHGSHCRYSYSGFWRVFCSHLGRSFLNKMLSYGSQRMENFDHGGAASSLQSI